MVKKPVVGDLLVGDVGYTQVVPAWYEVTRTNGTSVWVKRVNTYEESTDQYEQSGYRMPVAGSYREEKEHRHVLTDIYGLWGIKVNGNSFSQWNGKAKPFDLYN